MDDEDFFDDGLDMELLAAAEAQATCGNLTNWVRKPPVASTSKQPIVSSSKPPKKTTLSSSGKSQLVQTTLDGNTVTAKTRVLPIPVNRSEKAPVLKATKVWDRSVWAQRGWGTTKSVKKKGKGKRKATQSDDDEDGSDDDVDYGCDATLDDPDLDPSRPPPPMKLQLDAEAARSYTYPTSREVRSYQYNIVRKALFNNVLVSLPTGLGKTFIAAAVMYNFWRWYPQGKIIFLAPTRPLVTQQIQACYDIAPIPAEDCAEMTGQDPPSLRQEAWAKRRVFYCTPQTVQNDLKKGRIDASKIICIVLDEAHKASGDYAYCGVVRFLMNKNPHFRILALSATPGSTPDAVQAVIDALHIGHVECRTDNSMDVQQYMHRKHIVQQVVPLTPEFVRIRDNWAAIMREYANPLADKGVLHNGCRNVIALSSYSVQMAMSQIRQNNAAWAFPSLSILHKMAMAMDHLLTQSLSSFLKSVRDLVGLAQEKGQMYKALVNKDTFKICRREAEHLINAPGTYPHPKMDILKASLMEHFTASEKSGSSRAIVFCQYREVVEEIVDVLNRHRPLLKATRFVGQGTDKSGKRGIAQKEQVATIEKFKQGDYNVLVATSVGEEGLDIGEVDIIYCYDVGKSSIKMLQRIGRTGRAKDGRVLMLMNEDREEKNFNIAEEKYQDVQNAIVSGKLLEVYKDCDELNPNRKSIQVQQTKLDAIPFQKISLSTSTSRKPSTKAAKKPKDLKRNMPDEPDLNLGFRKASEAPPPKPAKKKPLYLRKREQYEPPALLSIDQIAKLQSTKGACESEDLQIDIGGKPLPDHVRTFKVGPSRRRAVIAAPLDAGRKLVGKPKAFKDWENATFSGFRQSDVHWWAKEQHGQCTRVHQSCHLPPRIYTPVLDLDKAKQGADVLAARDSELAVYNPSKKKPAKKVVDLDESQEENAVVVLQENKLVRRKKQKRLRVVESDDEDERPVASAVVRIEIDSSSDDDDPQAPEPDRPFVMPTAIDSDDGLDAALAALPPSLPKSLPAPLVSLPSSPEIVSRSNAPRVPIAIDLSESLINGDDDIVIPESDGIEALPLPPPKEASPELLPPSPQQDAIFYVPSLQDSDEEVFKPVTQLTVSSPYFNPPKAVSKPSIPEDDFDFDFDDINESELMLLDQLEGQQRQTDKQLMPPPHRKLVKRKSLSASDEADRKLAKVGPTSAPRRVVSSAWPGVQDRLGEDESSPVIGPCHRRRKIPVESSDRGTEDLVERQPKAKRSKSKKVDKKKVPNPFIDASQAICSDGSNNATSESEASENSIDREFITNSVDDGSPDQDMRQFYRNTLLSQHPAALGFQTSAKKPGAFKMRYIPAGNPSFQTQVRHSDSEVSDYLESSFCVGDDVVEFESSEI